MSRLTGKEVYSLMEAYQAVYQPELREDYLFEKFLNANRNRVQFESKSQHTIELF